MDTRQLSKATECQRLRGGLTTANASETEKKTSSCLIRFHFMFLMLHSVKKKSLSFNQSAIKVSEWSEFLMTVLPSVIQITGLDQCALSSTSLSVVCRDGVVDAPHKWIKNCVISVTYLSFL